MTKHVLIASMIAGLSLVPMAAMAADSSSDARASTQVKGPPNANGAKGNANTDTNTNAPAASGTNGAASAKVTGESGEKSK